MKYQDAINYTCKCGRNLTVPYPSMQRFPTLAPNEEELKKASYALTQEIIYHQNNTCPVMFAERRKAMLAIKPKSLIINKE